MWLQEWKSEEELHAAHHRQLVVLQARSCPREQALSLSTIAVPLAVAGALLLELVMDKREPTSGSMQHASP
jgi:hypothetical protein